MGHPAGLNLRKSVLQSVYLFARIQMGHAMIAGYCLQSLHRQLLLSFGTVVAIILCSLHAEALCGEEANSTAVSDRKPWTTSRIRGTPEAPNPFLLVPAFPNLKFEEPMQVRWSPELKRYLVCELHGKIWSFTADESLNEADLAVDLKKELKSFDPERSSGVQDVYSIALDPDFANNRFIYICMVFSSKLGKPLEDGTRVSRFRVVGDTIPRIDLQSEVPIIHWLAGGHNGCDLLFDNSGSLLISTGDATEPSPPDRLKTGQDISDLLSSILRIDVRGATKEKPYRIPEDNPFLDLPTARKEVWAFGFRNPWRMGIDRATDTLIVGDVGWEKWEMIHRVTRGGNYGWSVREGNELIQGDAPLGPSPVTPPWVALSHAEAASITGGFVYRGNQLDSLTGHYLFGDWVGGRVWAIPLDQSQSQREVASSTLRIIAFEPDANGEPLVVNHLNNTTLYRMVANDRYELQKTESESFPRRLSETGIFQSTPKQLPAEGVIRFSINHPMWQDGATAEHYLSLPNDAKVTVYDTPQPLTNMAMFSSRLHYPAGTVLAKSIRWKERLIETQLLHFDGSRWYGYSYIWNQDQTDAELAPREGKELMLDTDSMKRWRVHSRTECFQCHNPWPETTLAFTPEQLHQTARGADSTWLQLQKMGYVQTLNSQQEPIAAENCVRIALRLDADASIDDRARSYLHVNCAHCHQFGAGTGVAIVVRRPDPLEETKMISKVPEKGSLGLNEAKIVEPGEPDRSILLYRMASSSVGRMPHIGSREVDFGAVALIAQWINELKRPAIETPGTPEQDLNTLGQQLIESATGLDADNPKTVSAEQQIAEGQRRQHALKLAVLAAKQQSVGVDAVLSPAVLRGLTADKDTVISSLFEAYLPEKERVKRLHAGARFSEVEEWVGDPIRGRGLFKEQGRLQCSRCHQVGNEGGRIGPSFDSIGRRLTKSQLFESIAEPSRLIDPKYQTHLVMTNDGEVITGLLESESQKELVIITSTGEKRTISIDEISQRKLETQSLMPAGLLEQLTAQEMADLLAYLSSLSSVVE